MNQVALYPMPISTAPAAHPAPRPQPVLRPTVPRRSLAPAAPLDDSLSGAHILNRGERPLELSLLLTTAGAGVVSVRNRDRQPQLVRVLLLRRRLAAAIDCAGLAAVTLEPQHDGTIVAVEVPAFAEVDIRFRVARADEVLAADDATAQARAMTIKAARAG
jgi:hypothetical protein